MNNKEVMEQEIKNFDRQIEKVMNESSVTPPFGAWNRIAAELDAMPVIAGEAAQVAAASAPNSSWRFLAIAGVFVLTGLTTVGLFYKSDAVDHKAEVIAPAVEKSNAVNTTTVLNVLAEQKEVKTDKISPKVKSSGVAQMQEPIVNTQVIETEALDVQPVVAPATEVASLDVPNDMESYSLVFPAIDRDEAKVQFANSVKEQDDDDDNKAKVKSGSSYKMKFKKPKRQRFSYGHLNRVK